MRLLLKIIKKTCYWRKYQKDSGSTGGGPPKKPPADVPGDVVDDIVDIPGHANTWPGALPDPGKDADSGKPQANSWPMAGHNWNPEWDPLPDKTGNHLTEKPPVSKPKEGNTW